MINDKGMCQDLNRRGAKINKADYCRLYRKYDVGFMFTITEECVSTVMTRTKGVLHNVISSL